MTEPMTPQASADSASAPQPISGPERSAPRPFRAAPVLTPDGLPAAKFKASPDDFIVEEIPAYEASGVGEHLYVTFTKRDLTTPDAVRAIARALEVDASSSGYAGMKDKVGVTTQTASFPYPIARGAPDSLVETLRIPNIEIRHVARHGNKLKPGHLRGNRFTITLRGLSAEDAVLTMQRLEAVARRGAPNAFGPQRFGRDGDNPERALAWLAGQARGPRDKREQRMLFSSLQSVMFNEVLASRVADDTWSTVLLGDLAKKREGALFPVGEADLEDARLRAQTAAISATGPMFGATMRWPEGEVRELEARVLASWGLDEEKLRAARHLGEGTRRALRLEVDELTSFQNLDGVVLSFVLPKGGYATTVLAQVCTLQQDRDASHAADPRAQSSEATSDAENEP